MPLFAAPTPASTQIPRAANIQDRSVLSNPQSPEDHVFLREQSSIFN